MATCRDAAGRATCRSVGDDREALLRFNDRVVEAAHEAADLASFRRTLLRELACALGADTAMALPAPPELGGRAGDVREAGHFELDERIFAHYLAHRPRLEVELAPFNSVVSVAGAAVDTEVYGRGRDRLVVYDEILRPAGITSNLCFPLAFRGRVSSLVGLNRYDRRGFDASDVARVRSFASLAGMADAAVVSRTDARSDALSCLTAREREVARLIHDGLQNKEIAAVLGTSVDTVRKQTIAIYGKLGVAGRVQLVVAYEQALRAPCTPRRPR
jgi:DNA-binding CsgD family transcriptional regulator